MITEGIPTMRRVVFVLALASSLGYVTAWGQRAISAHSGLVNYLEGKVTLDDKVLEPKFTDLPEVKNSSVLASEEGRAEVLLTPGAFLRLSENSSFRMISNTLWDTRVEVVSGSALIEIDELLKDNSITVQYGEAQIALLKKGLYRLDAGDTGSLKVYDGEARVSLNGDGTTAHKGRQVELGTVLSASNFDAKDTDAFYRWSARRGEYIATANVSAARNSIGSGFTSSQWVFNPWYGMYTFVPALGFGYSPFGWNYYSPVTVGYLYPVYYGGGYGYGGGAGGAGRTIGGGSNVAPRTGNPAPSRVIARSPAASAPGFDLGAQSAAAPARSGGGFNGGGGGGFSGGGGGAASAPAAVAPHGGGGGAGGGSRGR
jgi:hypothetical protein